MEVRQLTRNSTNKVTKANLPKGHANGMIYVLSLKDGYTMDELGADLLTSTLRTEFQHEKTDYLCSNIPLSPMIGLSDINYGSTGVLSNIIQTSLTSGGTSVTVGGATNADKSDPIRVNSKGIVMGQKITFYVNYGSIWCNDGNELETEVEFRQMAAVEKVSVYSVSNDKSPHYCKKYDIDFDLNEEHKNISALYAFSDTLDKDANIVVNADSAQYDSDLEGFKCATMTFGQIENVHTGVVYSLFQTPDGIPEDVWAKVTKNGVVALNTENSRFGLLTIRNEFSPSLTLAENRKILYARRHRIMDFEQKHPTQAVAMQVSGMLLTSGQVTESIRAYNKTLQSNTGGTLGGGSSNGSGSTLNYQL